MRRASIQEPYGWIRAMSAILVGMRWALHIGKPAMGIVAFGLGFVALVGIDFVWFMAIYAWRRLHEHN